MDTVASRELRNNTAAILRRIEGGSRLTVTVNGQPVAELSPVSSRRHASISRRDLAALLARAQADSGLRGDLARLAGDTTEDLGPIR